MDTRLATLVRAALGAFDETIPTVPLPATTGLHTKRTHDPVAQTALDRAEVAREPTTTVIDAALVATTFSTVQARPDALFAQRIGAEHALKYAMIAAVDSAPVTHISKVR